jgi:formylglycine-generating enzyme required for sulfatase activity
LREAYYRQSIKNTGMKSLFRIFIVATFFIGCCNSLIANNVRITSEVSIVEQNTSKHYLYLQFDIAWDNSWRDTCNWDAVWVFFKYSNNNAWKHGYLSTDNTEYSVFTNNGVKPAFSVGTTVVNSVARGMGVFIYRDENASGSINWQKVKIKWYYGQNGLTDEQALNASVRLFAIETVYVPKGAFYLGYGNPESGYNSFHTRYYSGSYTPGTLSLNYYVVSSENALNFKSQYSNGTAGYFLSYNGSSVFTLSAIYPKGYAAFYCMKYEISQEQYVEFLNSLLPSQQENRISAQVANFFMSNVATTSSPLYRNGIRCKIAPTATTPGIWGCDLNKNGVFGESNDGQNIACNFISWNDAMAYADWAGLRPMTELEYEKSCKGPELIPFQFAWGTTNYKPVGVLSNSGTASESFATVGANVAFGNSANVQGPVRVGCFATNTSTRESAGASYYGIMELSGNLWEQVVPVYSSATSGFDGSIGDGELYSNGNTDVDGWLTNVGSGVRGGAWNSGSYYYLQSGDRSFATASTTERYEYNGFRCVRTAQ